MVISCPIDFNGYLSWVPIIFMVFTIVYTILAIMYMASKFINNPEYEARIKVEFTRQLISLFFILVIFIFAQILCSVTYTITGDINVFDTAADFVAKVGLVNIPLNLNKIWTSSINARILSTISLGMPSCNMGVCYTVFPVGTYVSFHLDMLGTIASPFSASMIVQLLFLDAIERYFLALLLPLGFLLKIAPFTRDAGAFLISLALSFYFILPLFFVMGSLIYDEISFTVIKNIKSTIPSFSEKSAMVKLKIGAFEFDNSNSLKSVGELGYYSMYAFTLPMLAVVVTIAGARALFPIFSKDFIGMGDM